MEIQRRVYLITGIDMKGSLNDFVYTRVYPTREDAINDIFTTCKSVQVELDDDVKNGIMNWTPGNTRLLIDLVPGEQIYLMLSSSEVTL